MPAPIYSPIEHDFPLQSLNTFGIAASARAYLRVTAPVQLQEVLRDPALAAMPRLVLGGGSNIVLTDEYVDALVLHMALSGRSIGAQQGDTVPVTAAAGENWHAFVEWTLAQGLGGLENLALIPGTVGAAPIQNIGAYGLEVRDVFQSATVFDSATGKTFSIDREACRFGYRDSIFKHPEGKAWIVLDVTFVLPAPGRWQPNLRYAELAQAVTDTAPTPRQVADAVIAIRRRKLPDPQAIGNAGSFFKNPVVSGDACQALLLLHPALVHHVQPDGSEKLAAGWLIDQCGWKGKRLGAAGVYEKQALVLVNHGGASGADVTALARDIQADVLGRFGVQLEPEPIFI